MENYIFLAAIVVIACIVFNKISTRIGVPVLFAFIILGMLFGADGLLKISFDDYALADKACSFALILIMFYSGFGTKWSSARPVAFRAMLLSSLGTVLTALIVGAFCRFVIGIGTLESLLIGSVICSTDAASVFAILRYRKLGLKYNTASLLEIESGSNDPFSYMLTFVTISLMKTGITAGNVVKLLLSQVAFGVVCGLLIGYLALLLLEVLNIPSGFDSVFILAIALLAFSVTYFLGGNGYLAVYISGLIIGNGKIKNKRTLVNFFDGATCLSQMALFFLLGLLSFPSKLPSVAPLALLVAVFLTFVARPIAVFAILAPFKCKLSQMLLVSWSGMRGAASIVFAIMAQTAGADAEHDIFHTVFFIVLFSILLQGTLIPLIAKKLKMTDDESDVMQTFTDYFDEIPVQFIKFVLPQGHNWVGKKVKELDLPPESIFVSLERDGEKISPKGSTVLCAGDALILCGRGTGENDRVNLYEKVVVENDDYIGKTLSQIKYRNGLVIMIRRGEDLVIPRGDTVIAQNDILVINEYSAL